MDPLTIIALLNALIQLVGPAEEAIAKIKSELDQNTEMTPEEVSAYEALKASDHAQLYWQAD